MDEDQIFTSKLENAAELINNILIDIQSLESSADEEEEKSILSDTLIDLAELRLNIINYLNDELPIDTKSS